MNKVVKRIDELRKLKGLTKKALMKKMGVPPSTCNGWYYADIMPSLSNIENVCIALEITTEQFFSGMDDKRVKSAEEKFLNEWRMLSDEEKCAIDKVIVAFKKCKEAKND